MFSFVFLLQHFVRAFRRSMKDKEFKGLLFLVLLILIVGTVFYSNVEHWRLFDSLYFCITTLTTVGLGDLSPQTDLGKAFTMIYILVGIGILLSFINLIASNSIEGYNERRDSLEKQREQRKAKSQ